MRVILSRFSLHHLAAVALLVVASACSIGYTAGFPEDRVARPATDAPERFLVGSHDSAATTEPVDGGGCRSPMVDPRDGTRLRLERSADQRGDYEVPAGRYGTGEGELLRLDCATGEVVGIVRR